MSDARNPGIPEPIFYTVSEASYLLGLAPSSIYDMHHLGKLTIRHIGPRDKKAVILKTDIDEYVKNAAMPRGVDSKNGRGKSLPNHPRRNMPRGAATAAPNGSGGAS